MIEQISELVKQFGQQQVVDNSEVPNADNNAVMSEVTSSITNGLQGELGAGGLQNILSMFGGQQNQQSLLNNPLVSGIVAQLIGKLTNRFNLSPNTAGNIANSIIPNVLGRLVANTQSSDPANDRFDLNDLIATLTGGNAAADNRQSNGIDFQDLIKQFTGGGTQPDLTDVTGQVTQKAQQQKEQGGGITDIIQSFFK